MCLPFRWFQKIQHYQSCIYTQTHTHTYKYTNIEKYLISYPAILKFHFSLIKEILFTIIVKKIRSIIDYSQKTYNHFPFLRMYEF